MRKKVVLHGISFPPYFDGKIGIPFCNRSYKSMSIFCRTWSWMREKDKVGPYLQIMIIKMKKNEELKDFETVGKDDSILKDGLWEF